MVVAQATVWAPSLSLGQGVDYDDDDDYYYYYYYYDSNDDDGDDEIISK